jgi:hypothetical protein
MDVMHGRAKSNMNHDPPGFHYFMGLKSQTMCQHRLKTAATAAESRGGVCEYHGFGRKRWSFSYSSMNEFG